VIDIPFALSERHPTHSNYTLRNSGIAYTHTGGGRPSDTS